MRGEFPVLGKWSACPFHLVRGKAEHGPVCRILLAGCSRSAVVGEMVCKRAHALCLRCAGPVFPHEQLFPGEFFIKSPQLRHIYGTIES